MEEINPNILLITVNVNELNFASSKTVSVGIKRVLLYYIFKFFCYILFKEDIVKI